MRRFVHVVVVVVALLMVVAPAVQLMSPVSSAMTRVSSGSRIPAVTGDMTVRHDVAFAIERVDLLDGPVSLPGFTVDLFVPPRA
jgi:hypothetical protein